MFPCFFSVALILASFNLWYILCSGSIFRQLPKRKKKMQNTFSPPSILRSTRNLVPEKEVALSKLRNVCLMSFFVTSENSPQWVRYITARLTYVRICHALSVTKLSSFSFAFSGKASAKASASSNEVCRRWNILTENFRVMAFSFPW